MQGWPFISPHLGIDIDVSDVIFIEVVNGAGNVEVHVKDKGTANGASVWFKTNKIVLDNATCMMFP